MDRGTTFYVFWIVSILQGVHSNSLYRASNNYNENMLVPVQRSGSSRNGNTLNFATDANAMEMGRPGQRITTGGSQLQTDSNRGQFQTSDWQGNNFVQSNGGPMVQTNYAANGHNQDRFHGNEGRYGVDNKHVQFSPRSNNVEPNNREYFSNLYNQNYGNNQRFSDTRGTGHRNDQHEYSNNDWSSNTQGTSHRNGQHGHSNNDWSSNTQGTGHRDGQYGANNNDWSSNTHGTDHNNGQRGLSNNDWSSNTQGTGHRNDQHGQSNNDWSSNTHGAGHGKGQHGHNDNGWSSNTHGSDHNNSEHGHNNNDWSSNTQGAGHGNDQHGPNINDWSSNTLGAGHNNGQNGHGNKHKVTSNGRGYDNINIDNGSRNQGIRTSNHDLGYSNNGNHINNGYLGNSGHGNGNYVNPGPRAAYGGRNPIIVTEFDNGPIDVLGDRIETVNDSIDGNDRMDNKAFWF